MIEVRQQALLCLGEYLEHHVKLATPCALKINENHQDHQILLFIIQYRHDDHLFIPILTFLVLFFLKLII
jgi:hypothetical protein